jgi:polysaccharide export outer membrane protein
MINKNRLKLMFCSFSLLVLASCVSEKKLTYFQKSNPNDDTVTTAKAYIPKIQPGDLLSIPVTSLSPEASSFFNPYNGGSMANAGAGSANPLYQSSTPGYLVDPAGNIDFPLIGSIKILGYTTAQVRDTLKSHLKTYLKEPTVSVRFLNFKISVLGEVTRPEVYNVPNEMITLPEALSLAGDLTPFARRDSIQIIRDVDGKKEFGYVDLTKRNVFNSPYYYLHANDVVYIKPSKARAQQSDRSLQYYSIGVSLLSLIIVAFRR